MAPATLGVLTFDKKGRTTFPERMRQHAEQQGADRVAIALMKREPTPGMRVKPIEPDKYYREARINDGDRTIFREDAGTVLFVDVVPHDDIGKYGRKPPGA